MLVESKRPILFIALSIAVIGSSLAVAEAFRKQPREIVAVKSYKIDPALYTPFYELAEVRRQKAEQLAAEQRALQEAEAARLAQAAKVKASRSSRAPRQRAAYAGPVSDALLDALARCESGMRPTAVSRSGKYFGAFQWSLTTWHALGQSGSPVEKDYEYQKNIVRMKMPVSSWHGQFPVCSRKIGV